MRIRSRLARAVVAALLAAIALATRPAHAQQAGSAPAPIAAALNWVRMPGADSCVAPQALARAVEQRVGHPVFVAAGRAEWAIEGRIERANDAWLATLRASRGDGTTGTRTVRRVAPDCAAIDPQLVLVIALLLDPETSLEVDTPASPQRPNVAPAAAPPSPPPTRTPPPPPPRPARVAPTIVIRRAPPLEPRRLALEVGAQASLGLLPELAPGAFVTVEWAPLWPVLRVRGTLGGLGPIVVSPPAGSEAPRDASALFAGTYASVVACVAAPRASWATLCAGVLAAAVYGAGRGFTRDIQSWNVGVALPIRVGVEVPLAPRWSLRPAVTAVVPLVWPRLAVCNGEVSGSGTCGQVLVDFGPSSPIALTIELAAAYTWR